jgi:pullulanase/glycogen debranching enzyme
MPSRGGLLVVTLSLLISCSSGGGTRYPTPPAEAPLGVAWDPAGGTATFRVWAPAVGTAAVLFLTGTAVSATHPMTKDPTGGGDVDASGWNGVWEATVTGVPEAQLYQYSLGGRAALDPYAPSMGRFDGSQAVGRGAVLRPDTLKPLDLSTPAPDDVEEMVPFTAPEGYARREDAIVYEVHVRDFTVLLPPADLVHAPGSYLAFTERLDHVKRLGATHVQLLPVLAYFNGDESGRGSIERVRKDRGNNYNWGYDPHSWFAPSGMYVTYPADPGAPDVDDPRVRVRELKTLVNEAHKRGLGVTLDVVYNHTANTGILDALAPGYYYRGSNYSGVGNDTASERKMMRKLVVESVAHLVREYQVDGFRFDLMGLIDSTTMTEAYAAAAALNPNVLFIGEGWRSGGVPAKDYLGLPIEGATQDWMDSTDDVAVFSDSFRDIVKGGGFGENDPDDRGFLTLASVDKNALLRNLRGDPTNFTATTPADSVQYLTAHDGLTLHDKIGKILGLDPAGAEIPKVARLGFVLQATSQGIAFINGGCEFGRSKWVDGTSDVSPTANWSGDGSLAYVRDSYDASDAVNGFDWALLAPGTEGARLLDYVRGLYALRRSSDAFRLGSKALAASNVTLLDGSRASAIAYRVVDSAGTTGFSVFVNAGTTPAVLATGDDLTAATVVVDSDEAGPAAVATPSGFSALDPASVTVAPRTAVVFRAPRP